MRCRPSIDDNNAAPCDLALPAADSACPRWESRRAAVGTTIFRPGRIQDLAPVQRPAQLPAFGAGSGKALLRDGEDAPPACQRCCCGHRWRLRPRAGTSGVAVSSPYQPLCTLHPCATLAIDTPAVTSPASPNNCSRRLTAPGSESRRRNEGRIRSPPTAGSVRRVGCAAGIGAGETGARVSPGSPNLQGHRRCQGER